MLKMRYQRGFNAVSALLQLNECEELFFDPRLLVYYDKGHSRKENRYYALGNTFAERKLFVVYTLRGEKARVISARDMNKKERKEHEKGEKDTSIQD